MLHFDVYQQKRNIKKLLLRTKNKRCDSMDEISANFKDGKCGVLIGFVG